MGSLVLFVLGLALNQAETLPSLPPCGHQQIPCVHLVPCSRAEPLLILGSFYLYVLEILPGFLFASYLLFFCLR
jgi:hypothetical protein